MSVCKYCKKHFVTFGGHLSCKACRENPKTDEPGAGTYKNLKQAFDLVVEERNRVIRSHNALVGQCQKLKDICALGEKQFNLIKEEMLDYKLALIFLRDRGDETADSVLKRHEEKITTEGVINDI